MTISILPEYEEDVLDQENAIQGSEIYPDTTWILNEDTKTIGSLEDDRVKCVAQAIKIALRTEQQEYEMYPIWYGSTLNEHLGETRPHVYAAIERSVRDCLATDDRVESVENFTFADHMGNVIVTFHVSVNGEDIEIAMEVGTNGGN